MAALHSAAAYPPALLSAAPYPAPPTPHSSSYSAPLHLLDSVSSGLFSRSSAPPQTPTCLSGWTHLFPQAHGQRLFLAITQPRPSSQHSPGMTLVQRSDEVRTCQLTLWDAEGGVHRDLLLCGMARMRKVKLEIVDLVELGGKMIHRKFRRSRPA
jgi:hypothetical protein